MSYKNCFWFLLLTAMMLLGVGAARACLCGPAPTVLDAYEDADVVVIARTVAVNKSDDGEVQSIRMTVGKVYKGNLKVADEISFMPGGGADCMWTFEGASLENEYLFYLNRRVKEAKAWKVVGCGRSGLLEEASDDLFFLNNLEKLRGKTRISGTLQFSRVTDLSAAGRRVRIIGAKKTYEVKTDRKGFYEIYGLPPGEYAIEPEAPPGWKIDPFYLRYSPSIIEDDEEEEAPKQVRIKLEAKKHARLDIYFEIDNAIRGRVFDPSGRPMNGVCVSAVPVHAKEGGANFDCTDENGNFAITPLGRDSYVLAVNDDGKISSSEPFKTFYYPGVSERERASVLTIAEGETIEGINIYAPKIEETITIEGLFLYEDGKAVVNESVQFRAAGSVGGIDDHAQARTDARGRFSLKVLKGLKGRLYGSMYTYTGEFKNCPQLESLIKKSDGKFAEVESPALEIETQNNLYNVELKFPFPACEKAEEEKEEEP